MGKGNGQVDDTKPRLRNHRRRPKRCAIGCYHLGAVLLLIGLVVGLVGVCSDNLFEILIYDNRHPPLFHHISVHVGLFAIKGTVNGNFNKTEALQYPPILDEPLWLTGKAFAVIGLMAAVVALLMHVCDPCCSGCRSSDEKPWGTVTTELLFFFIAVIGLLVALSLAESQIEGVHNHGDAALARMLQDNALLGADASVVESFDASAGSPAAEGSLRDPAMMATPAEFNLVLSPSRFSFHVLIAADFLCLLAFLCALVFFVRLSEREEQQRKQLQKAKVAKPSAEQPLV